MEMLKPGHTVHKKAEIAPPFHREVSDHGGNIYKVAEETGIPENRIIDFSASINPLGLSESVKQVIQSEMDGLVNYPDPDAKKLKQKIAHANNIDAETIVCGNGSTELIYLIPRALRPKNVLIPAPTFSEYEKAVRLNENVRVKRPELRAENKFRLNADEFASEMQGCDMAFLCNPNNPTGALMSREEVREIAKEASRVRCCLVVDEAFIDFIPEESVITDTADNPYLVVLRSMTKFHAITGLRVGYGAFHQELINKVQKYKEPWTVNNLAQAAGAAALGDKYYIEETYSLMKREKEFLEKSFDEAGIRYYPSSANYFLIKIPPSPPLPKEGITDALRRKGILVRDCSNFKGLDGSYIRVAVKSREHNEMLIKELQAG